MRSAGQRQAYRAWVKCEQQEAAERPRCAGPLAARWNTGHDGNVYAYAICARCPLPAVGDCKPYEGVAGVIVAGVAYDDHGRALEQCPDCLMPIPINVDGVCKRRSCPSNQQAETVRPSAIGSIGPDQHRPAAYRKQITEMTLAGVPRAQIAAELRLPERGLRAAQTRWGLTGAKLAARLAEEKKRSAA